MTKVDIKVLVAAILIFIATKFLLDELFDIGILALIVSAALAGGTYLVHLKFKNNENVLLVVSIVFLLSASLSIRYLRKTPSLNPTPALLGTWCNTSEGDSLVFQFKNVDMVEVTLDEDQEEELIYNYKLNNNHLMFFANDTLRFDWELKKLSEKTFIISQEGEYLEFRRVN